MRALHPAVPQSDVYSFGVLGFEVALFGAHPLQAQIAAAREVQKPLGYDDDVWTHVALKPFYKAMRELFREHGGLPASLIPSWVHPRLAAVLQACVRSHADARPPIHNVREVLRDLCTDLACLVDARTIAEDAAAAVVAAEEAEAVAAEAKAETAAAKVEAAEAKAEVRAVKEAAAEEVAAAEAKVARAQDTINLLAKQVELRTATHPEAAAAAAHAAAAARAAAAPPASVGDAGPC